MSSSSSSPDMGAPAGEKRIFVRRASGLIRIIGPYAATGMAVLNTSPSYSGTISLSWVPYLWPGVNVIWILFLGIWLCGLQGTNYAMVGTLMPRSGADYVFGSRLWRPDILFGVYIAYIIYSGVTAGVELAMNSYFIQVPLYTYGSIFKIPWMLDAAKWLVSYQGWWIVGLVSLVGLFILMIMPTRIIVQYMNIAFTLAFPMYIIIFATLGWVGPTQFIANWNSIIGAGNFQAVVPAATSNGLSFITSPFDLSMGLMASTLVTYWVYYGWNMPVIFAGEVSSPEKSLMIANWGCQIITGVFFCGEAWLMYRLTSIQWVAAEAYIGSFSTQAGSYFGGIPSAPFISFYSAVAVPNPLLIGFVGIVEVIDEIALPGVYWFYSSRTIFAMAFDRILPEAMAYVHPTLRSPVWAMAVMALMGLPGIAMQAGVVSVPMNFIWVAVLHWLFIAYICFLLPKKMPEVWNAAPTWFRKKVAGVTIWIWMAGFSVVMQVWNLIGMFVYPAVGGVVTYYTVAGTFGMAVVATIYWHWRRRQILRKEGFDVYETFRAIPPA
jgi:APA family basic amino acid/polyamine antiporter